MLYTGLEREGALAEIGYRLSLEPVWPSRIRHELHQLTARCERTLHFPDIAGMGPLGVDTSRFPFFDYSATQALAAAAHFLKFDGLIVPSARHGSSNLILFMDRVLPGSLQVTETGTIDWTLWRHRTSR